MTFINLAMRNAIWTASLPVTQNLNWSAGIFMQYDGAVSDAHSSHFFNRHRNTSAFFSCLYYRNVSELRAHCTINAEAPGTVFMSLSRHG